MMRKNRRDFNHQEIVAAFREAGCSVQDASRVGAGCPDLFVGLDRRHHAVEVKQPKTGRVQHTQIQWASETRGCWHLVKTIDDVAVLVLEWRTKEFIACK